MRNKLILNRMRELGIKSQTQLAILSGLKLRTVNDYVCLNTTPVSNIDGEWLDSAYTISSALHVEPEELWADEYLDMTLVRRPRKSIEVSMSEYDTSQLPSRQGTQQMVQKLTVSKVLSKNLQKLTLREQDIIKSSFFDGEQLYEIGARMGVTSVRIRQIQQKALQRLKKHLKTDYKAQLYI
jgi:RNA polymerase sigma factor (sigma-70 family)